MQDKVTEQEERSGDINKERKKLEHEIDGLKKNVRA